jgi:hypothetical protein
MGKLAKPLLSIWYKGEAHPQIFNFSYFVQVGHMQLTQILKELSTRYFGKLV